MTNGEKMISVFPNGEVRKCEKGVVFSTGGWCHAYADEWWNADCEEPTIKNNLGVEEVTALAEWTEKLTKASEDAYNKGYADGMKAQEPKIGHWINTANPRMSDNIVCSECGYDSIADYKFCPNCGADMREVEE